MTAQLRLPTEVNTLGRFAADLAQFTVENIAERIGSRARSALDREDPIPASMAASGDDPLALLIRLFLLGEALTEAQLRTALPTSADDALCWGVVTGEDEFRAGVDLRPTTIAERDVWLAADLTEIATGQPLRADHVLGLGGASATLVDLTVRTPVTRALDLGTGSGIQALGLANHAGEVVASDISERALAFAAFNIALNAATARARGERAAPAMIDLRQGSFFEPIDGEFDLIVSNPPFVVSPQESPFDTYTYRDGGYVGDGVVAHLIEEIPRFLRPGGIAQMLANWEVHGDEAWDARIGEWVRKTGLDAWVIQREFVDPAHYVHTWIRDGGLTPDRDPARYDKSYRLWLEDLDQRGVTAIAFGYVILRKPALEREPWVRLEEVTGTIADNLAGTIATTLAEVERLAGASEEEILSWHLQVASDVGEERYYHPGDSDPSIILLRQGGGLARAVQADTLTAAVVGACDGELTVGQICSALAQLLEVDEGAVIADVLASVRGLLTDGLLTRVDPERR